MFCFPYIEWEKTAVSPLPIPHPEGILWGVRLLQILEAAEQMITTGIITDRMTVREISGLLEVLFNYPRRQSHTLIEMFSQAEFLSIGPHDGHIHGDIARQQPHLLPKGRYVISRFIYDIAYLNLCAMRVPLRRVDDADIDLYFIPASLEALNKPTPNWDIRVPENLVRWIASKIINSCALLRLVDDINALQRERYSGVFDNRSLNSRQVEFLRAFATTGNHREMFNFSHKIRLAILAQIRAAVGSLQNDDPRALDEIERLLVQYLSYRKKGAEVLS